MLNGDLPSIIHEPYYHIQTNMHDETKAENQSII